MKRAALVAVAAVLLASTAAGADPVGAPTYREWAGTGIAATEGLFNGLSEAVTRSRTKIIGSYDTTGSPTITPRANCVVPRTHTIAAKDGCLQFARAGTYNTLPEDAVYFPMGLAPITYATAETTIVPKDLHTQYLGALYKCQIPNAPYKPLLPRYGSTVRTEFIRSMFWGVDDGPDFTTRFPCIQDTVDGVPIEENNGAQLTLPSQLIPYGVPGYLAQLNGLVPGNNGGAGIGRLDEISSVRIDPEIPATAISYAMHESGNRDLTDAQLRKIYTCQDTAYSPVLPRYGSWVRQGFLGRLGIPDRPDLSTVYPCVRDGGVEHDDGTVLTGRRDIVPFSVQSYVDQVNTLFDDTRARTLIGRIGGVNPVAGKRTHLGHGVYTVVPKALAAKAAPVFGEGGLVCARGAVIRYWGFVDELGCGRPFPGSLDPRAHLPRG
ncbi:hypothetical protein JOD54_006412 [Actinokineospora baliensis]|uniref:hypothetical protein n=1 Tax=Actinokineospora baliensis TaxID=547056 RepID=UPI0019575F28|nr:hypothetical protein [Actinokineospora baliensis]MBM7776208.1 hypothetical protein [Actinokineospora baliensis]